MKSEILEGDIDLAWMNAVQSCETIALDCETSGLDWQTDSLALVQLYAPEYGTVFLRPLESVRPTNLISIMESQQVQKVFHHAMFDLRFLVNMWSFVPKSVKCTKIMAKLLDPAGVQSLKPLLKTYLGIEITKDLQTSDWFAAELSKEQLEYASNDVAHLPALETVLSDRLTEAGLENLTARCFRHLPTRVELELLGYSDVYVY